MENKQVKGLIPAIATPFKMNGEINFNAIDCYAQHLISLGVDGVFINGTTGEGLLMTTDERKSVAEAWMRYSNEFAILVHVGSTSYKIAGELAAHAESIGVDVISAMGPCFLQPSRPQELVEFNKQIAKCAPNTPYYYYHIPMTSGVNVSMFDFLTLAIKEIPTLCGIKYTSYNTMEMQECIEFNNRSLNILHGHDETLLMGLIIGANGGIGTSYSVTARLLKKLIAAFEAGNTSQAVQLQAEVNSFVRVMIKYVNSVVGIKAILSIIGIDCGPCRLPLRNLTLDEMKSLEADLKSIGWI